MYACRIFQTEELYFSVDITLCYFELFCIDPDLLNNLNNFPYPCLRLETPYVLKIHLLH